MLATECSQPNFEFEGRWSRSVVARFDRGRISSHGGGLLRQEVEKRVGLLSRLSNCFRDGRDQRRVRHGVQADAGSTCLLSGFLRLALAGPVTNPPLSARVKYPG